MQPHGSMSCLVLATIVAVTLLVCAEAGPSASTYLGRLNGTYCAGPDGKILKFLGIPFAKPPVGKRRFAAPRKWDAKYAAAGRDATKYGPSCMQAGDSAASENCLYLNIWTPTTSSKANLPVRVFIHGGGYQTGSGGDVTYDSCKVAADGNVVAVTINYRLGVLGFLALPGLNDTTAGGTTGNWGLLDQRLALWWVKENIRSFGGDPNKVLMTGESAGAYSTFLHTLMPKSQGLFAAAAPISGSTDVMATDFLKDAYTKGRALAAALRCDVGGPVSQKECLMKARAADVIAAQAALGPAAEMYPAIDGVQIPKAPLRLMQEGKTARVPILIGVNENEGVLEATGATNFNFDIDMEQFGTALTGLVRLPRAFQNRVLAQYNNVTYNGWFGALTQAITEGGYWCPSYRMARAFAKQPGSPVRFFVLDLVRPTSGCPIKASFGLDWGLDFATWFGAFHGYDVGMTFLAPYRDIYTSMCNFTDSETQTSSFMSGILSGFAASASPLPPRSKALTAPQLLDVKWPAWSAAAKPIAFLGGAGAPAFLPAPGVLDTKCKLWDDILEYNVKRGTNYDP